MPLVLGDSSFDFLFVLLCDDAFEVKKRNVLYNGEKIRVQQDDSVCEQNNRRQSLLIGKDFSELR